MSLDFVDALWNEQQKYMENVNKPYYMDRFKASKRVFDNLKEGQTAALISCGSNMQDVFMTLENIGNDGKIILIDKDPKFVYERAKKIVGESNLPKGEDYYVSTDSGKKYVKKLFSSAGIETYVKFLPPYPKEIQDNSLNSIIGVDTAFELTCSDKENKADTKGIFLESYKKLKTFGNFFVQGRLREDISDLNREGKIAVKQNNLRFILENKFEQSFDPKTRKIFGVWTKWVKV